MKTIYKLTFVLMLMMLSQLTFSQTGNIQTEEYAIIGVKEYHGQVLIGITVGSGSTVEKEYKTEKKFDMTPVIAEMEKLNKMGYKLFSSSSSKLDSGSAFYTLIFKKEK